MKPLPICRRFFSLAVRPLRGLLGLPFFLFAIGLLLSGPVPGRAQGQPAPLPAPGRYLVTVVTASLGRVQLLFELRAQADSLVTGTTAPELPRRLVGGVTGALVGKSLFDNGTLAKLNLRRPGPGRPSRLAVAYQGVLDVVPAPTAPGQPGFRAELRDIRTGAVRGSLVAEPTALAAVRPDYPALVARLLALAEEKLYNPALLQQKPWRDYRAYLLEKAPSFVDDGDLLFASLYKARGLPFSHFYLMGDKTAVPAAVARADAPAPGFRLAAPNVAVLDLPQFNMRAATVDSLLALVRQSVAQVLVIDLRRNTGGDMEGGMRLLQHLTAQPLFGGTMLSQRWWQAHQAPATAAEAAQFPRLDRASYAEFRQQRGTVAGLTLHIEPLAPQLRLRLPVYVLTSRRTASAAEPVVFGIQYYKIGQIVGETTAGAVLSMEELPLDRYTLQVPMLSYYAPNGRELDQVGVRPDHPVAANHALEFVLEKLLPATARK